MPPPLPDNLAILARACERFGYTFTLIDTFSGYLAEVSDGATSFLAGAGPVSCFPLNAASALTVAKDKGHTYTLLRHHGIAIPQTGHFFVTPKYADLRPPGREFGEALAFADQIGYPVFVKPNAGSGARDTGAAYDQNTLIYLLQAIAEQDYIAIVQEFLTTTEYRFFVLDGEIEFAYSKHRPVIMGDGAATIRELMAEIYTPSDKPPTIFDTAQHRFFEAQCAQKGLTLDAVLPSGETLLFSATRKLLSRGPIDQYFTTFSEETRAWVRMLAARVHLRVMSVDFFAERGLADPSTFKIIEVNGTPALATLYDTERTEEVMAIWEKILARAFG